MTLGQRLRQSLQLCGIFMKIGAFTFGGGYAMIPIIERETAEKRHLIEKEEILDVVAIAESTPGPISINAATFIGYRTAGVMGAAFATFGLVLPSFLTILLIAFFLRNFMENIYVQYAFFGIRAGVLALMVKAVIGFWKKAQHNVFSIVVMAAAFLWSAVLDWNVIAMIALCGVAGFIFCTICRKRGKME